MKAFNNILVLENDLEVPSYINHILELVNVPKDYWYNFIWLFYHSRDENMKRLGSIPEDTLLFAAPSFVGAENQFSSYLNLFLQLAEAGKKLDIAVVYYDGFFMYLLKFLYKEHSKLKNENNHRMLKEVLDAHNIYEIDFKNLDFDELEEKGLSSQSKRITYEALAEFYYDAHRTSNTKIRIKDNGKIKDLIHVNHYCDRPEDIKLELGDKSATVFTSSKYMLYEIERI